MKSVECEISLQKNRTNEFIKQRWNPREKAFESYIKFSKAVGGLTKDVIHELGHLLIYLNVKVPRKVFRYKNVEDANEKTK